MVKYFPSERLAINRGLMKALDSLFNKYSLNSPNNPAPFFIIGAGRSGTTLLRTILNNHPDICIPPESFGFRNGFYKFKSLQNCSWEVLSNAVLKSYSFSKEFFLWDLDLSPAFDQSKQLPTPNRTLADLIHLVFQSYLNAKDPTATVWGDKTPLNTYYLEWIFKTFPQAKFINMIRDGRDVVSSLIKANLTNVQNGCLRWNLAVDNARNFESQLSSDNFITIHYEDLVTSPYNTIQSICMFLDIQFNKSMLANDQKTDKMMDVKYYEHFKNLLNPINNQSIGKWEKNLSKNEQNIVSNKLFQNLKLLGYLKEI